MNIQREKRINHYHRKRCAHIGADGDKCKGFAVNHEDIAPANRVIHCHRHLGVQAAEQVNNDIHSFEKPDECPVCYENTSDLLELKPCKHWLCKSCLDKITKNECPYCRTVLTIGQKKTNQSRSLPADSSFRSYMIRIVSPSDEEQRREQRRQQHILQYSPRRNHVEDFLESGRRLFNYPAYMSREELRYNLLANWWGSR